MELSHVVDLHFPMTLSESIGCFNLLFEKLSAVQVSVLSLNSQELLMCAAFDYPPIVDDTD